MFGIVARAATRRAISGPGGQCVPSLFRPIDRSEPGKDSAQQNAYALRPKFSRKRCEFRDETSRDRQSWRIFDAIRTLRLAVRFNFVEDACEMHP